MYCQKIHLHPSPFERKRKVDFQQTSVSRCPNRARTREDDENTTNDDVDVLSKMMFRVFDATEHDLIAHHLDIPS